VIYFGDRVALGMTFDYDSWLRAVRDRLEVLYREKVAIEDEISKLERGIEGFVPLAPSASAIRWPAKGVTEATRVVLKGDPNGIFSPTQIRDELLGHGVPLRQKNPMATIHQVLARLVQNGEVTVHIFNGKNGYRWIGKEGKDDVMAKSKRRRTH
jgi:hypothetical protein